MPETNNDEWKAAPVVPQLSMATAKMEAKKLEFGKWKWAKPSGNGKTTAYFVCNAHVNCGRHLRIAMQSDIFFVWLKGKHAAEPTFGKRVNSTLSWQADETLRVAVTQGARPGAVYAGMLKDASLHLKAAGEDPLSHKKAGGGLEGELLSSRMQEPHNTGALSVLLRIMSVFLSYFPCIQSVFTEVRNTTYSAVLLCIAMY